MTGWFEELHQGALRGLELFLDSLVPKSGNNHYFFNAADSHLANLPLQDRQTAQIQTTLGC